jgi:Sulfotransferase family
VLPNFFIIGADRSGTTSLYHALAQHPQIYMCPIKEPNFFAYDGRDDGRWSDHYLIRTLAEYETLFAAAREARAIGEASTAYLHSSFAAEQIKVTLPHARLVAILRDPVDRAFAQYLAEVRLEGETRNLARWAEAALKGERRYRIENGFYYRHLQPYVDRFGSSQLAVNLYDDYKAGPIAVLARVFCYLQVDDAFRPDMAICHNVSGLPKSRLVERFLRRRRFTRKIKRQLPAGLVRSLDSVVSRIHEQNRIKPVIPAEVRHDLIQIYRDDILNLEALIGRDLSAWRSFPEDTKRNPCRWGPSTTSSRRNSWWVCLLLINHPSHLVSGARGDSRPGARTIVG